MMNGKHKVAKKYLENKLKGKGKRLILLNESEKVLKSSMDGPQSAPGEVTFEPCTAAENSSFMKMLLNKRILKQVVIFAFVSTVNSLVYYALSLMATDLSGDRNVSLFLSGIVE